MNYYETWMGDEISDKDFLLEIIKSDHCPRKCEESCQVYKECHGIFLKFLNKQISLSKYKKRHILRKQAAIKCFIKKYGEDSLFEAIL